MAARCILHIEDNPDALRLVRRILEPKGYTILEARDGLTGIDLARSHEHVDLILLDINIPGLDGYEVATRIKALPALDGVPIVAITANASMGDREKCLVAGCDGYVAKPIDILKFDKIVQEYLAGRHDHVPKTEEAAYLRQHSGRMAGRLEDKIRELEKTNQQLENHNLQMQGEVATQAGKLQEAQNQLIQSAKLAAMGEMVAGVSHELSNPLTSIAAFVQVLKRDLGAEPFEKERLQRTLQSLDQATRQLGSIIDRFLGFAKKEDTQLRSVQLHEVIEESLRLTAHAAMKKNLSLLNNVSHSHPPVHGIANQLVQVFTNLIINAIYACADDQPGKIEFVDRLIQQGRYIEIDVSDNGTGIVPEVVPHLFEPFFTTRREFGGTGLGLSVSKEIIQRHQGKINVRSKVGEGTTFTVVLPVHAV